MLLLLLVWNQFWSSLKEDTVHFIVCTKHGFEDPDVVDLDPGGVDPDLGGVDTDPVGIDLDPNGVVPDPG